MTVLIYLALFIAEKKEQNKNLKTTICLVFKSKKPFIKVSKSVLSGDH